MTTRSGLIMLYFSHFSQIHKTVKNVTEETTKSRTGQIEDLTFDPARTGLVWSGMEINWNENIIGKYIMLVLESHLGLITEGQFPIWGQAEDNVHTWELIYTACSGQAAEGPEDHWSSHHQSWTNHTAPRPRHCGVQSVQFGQNMADFPTKYPASCATFSTP